MKNLTFLVPLKDPKYDVLNNLINSLDEKVQIICCGNYDKEKITRTKKVKHIAKDGLLSECLNEMLEHVKTEYLSILAWDDEITNIYMKRAKDYTEAYKDVDIFLTMILERTNLKQPIGYTNNSVWANQFTDVQGYLDFETLNRFSGYSILGSIIKTDVFKNVGRFKPSNDVLYDYEFLLRVTSNDKKVFVIPKLMYIRNSRLDNRTQQLKSKYNVAELNEFRNKAKKECYFKIDR